MNCDIVTRFPSRTALIYALAFFAACADCDTAIAQRSIRVLDQDYPHAFFFRASEGFARKSTTEFEDWDSTFSRLMGIEGKVLDEEIPGTAGRNIPFFTRFKSLHPEQLVLLHYNGNARDPRYQIEDFFAGHWLYYEGQKLLEDLPAEEGEIELHVEHPSWFRVNIGRYRNSNDDIGICELDEEGRPDWHRSEQVQLVSVDPEAKTIRIRRGCYGSTPRCFDAGRAYLAVHINEGPWGRKNNLMWHYNYSTCCPRDAKGRTCSDVHAAELAARFANDGELAAFDGLEFDVLGHSKRNLTRRGTFPGADCDGDGVADAGVFDGVDKYALGVLGFLADLRQRMGEDRLILADGHNDHHQRGFGILNGIESEGWPTLSDWQMRDWSGGMNRHSFWAAFGRKPQFNYINHKYITHGELPGITKRPEYPAGINRLVFAAAVFTDAAVCYSITPRPEPGERFGIWDELRMGRENRLGWLGKPVTPTVRMAEQTPDLLNGSFSPANSRSLDRIDGESITAEVNGQSLKISATGDKPNDIHFRMTDVPVQGEDLFIAMTASADSLPPYPATMARLAYVGIQTAQPLIEPGRPLVGWMQRRGEAVRPLDTATGAQVARTGTVQLGDRSCTTIRVHPPYRDRKTGLVYWEQEVTIRPRTALTFCTGMSERAPGRSDGVVFQVQAVSIDDRGIESTETLFQHTQIESRWIEHRVGLESYAGKKVCLRFVADAGPKDNSTTDQGMWGDVYLIASDAGKPVAPRSERFMTWVGVDAFKSGFAFSNLDTETVDLTFQFEGKQPVYLQRLTVHAASDIVYRAFENGVVIANPSPHPITVDIAKLFTDRRFRRLQGSSNQDPKTNNGRPVGPELTLPARDALFLVDQDVQ